ncbi:MAG: hypothetical protein GY941_15810 [Planctomycetes bacterium]|nr:hypothetical protein [Planctomycetota bacterium]
MAEGSPGDMPELWDAYIQGYLKLQAGLTIDEFIEFVAELSKEVAELWVVEDYISGNLEMIAIVICKSDGWLLEPHVIYFPNATARAKYRTFAAFIKKTKYRKDIGACLVRTEKHEQPLPQRAVKMGLLEYVGKIWGGKPSGNEYLYSARCGRRVN